MANLSLKHIYKVYPNGTKAVNDFNMQIDDKEFIVFVGPSGCGKSTMLRMIAGLEEITAGELRIGDIVVNDMEPKDRDIAMVFQNYALYPHMNIYENIAFGLKMRKLADVKKDKTGKIVTDKNGEPVQVMRHLTKAELDEKVYGAAEILGITDYLRKKPKEMSGGQRQRVALGRAIVREPKVMLLDEPLSNLDAKLRTQMRSEIVKLHNKLQTTFIYVTHDQVEAMTMGTRIVVMKDGYVQQIDTPKNLYQMPANKFVAGFIGTPQMNFFEGTLKKTGEEVEVKFNGSDSVVKIPYGMLVKVMPQYLDGKTNVYIGLRADDVTIDPDEVNGSSTTIKVKISHTEELGTETLVYGDIDMSRDSFGESPTQIILKAAGFKNFSSGDVVDAALKMENVHLFDAQTEESILPRIPKYNYLDCAVKDGALTFAGVKIKLPDAIKCADGEYELLLPTDAIAVGGDVAAEVLSCEQTDGKTLARLNIGGNCMFALIGGEPGQKVGLSLDLKKITLRSDGKDIISPMPLINSVVGTFALDRVKKQIEEGGKLKTKKVSEYSFVMGGRKFKAPLDVAQKMFAALSGRKVFNTAFHYEWSPYDMAISDDGIEGEVTEVLDYGAEQFAKVDAAGSTLYIKTTGPVSGKVHVSPDMSSVSVVEKDRNIRIV